MALLTAAEKLDGAYRPVARPILATLAGTGLRIGEALELEWRDVNLGARTLRVRQSKTDAGVRDVDLTPAVVEELGTLKESPGRRAAGDPVFASVHRSRRDQNRPTRLDRHRVRSRSLLPTIKAANGILVEKGIEPIGAVTIHGLRRTYASLRFAAGDDPVYIAQQIGHTSSRFTMDVYAKATKRRNRLTGETRIAFERAIQWAENGRIADQNDIGPPGLDSFMGRESAESSGF
ncbi:MAG: site-specific integrase [Thermoleophilia bacterium]|nr:site-specific integrase [Thermoleophilia bacterium]